MTKLASNRFYREMDMRAKARRVREGIRTILWIAFGWALGLAHFSLVAHGII